VTVTAGAGVPTEVLGLGATGELEWELLPQPAARAVVAAPATVTPATRARPATRTEDNVLDIDDSS